MELRLEYVGGGRFQSLTKLDFDLCTQDLAQGDRVKARITKPRSVRQNNLLHALIQAAHENQRGGPKFETWEHLKAWLLIEAGHCEEIRYSIGRIDPKLAMLVAGGMVAAIRQRFEFMAAGIDRGRNEVVMRFAKSVSFRQCDSETMAGIMDRVVAHICTDIVPGMDPESILNMAKARAA